MIHRSNPIWEDVLTMYIREIHPIPITWSDEWHRWWPVVDPQLTMSEWIGYYKWLKEQQVKRREQDGE